MTSSDTVRMTRSMRNGVCSIISLEPIESDRYRVHNGFTFTRHDDWIHHHSYLDSHIHFV